MAKNSSLQQFKLSRRKLLLSATIVGLSFFGQNILAASNDVLQARSYLDTVSYTHLRAHET